MAAVAETGSLDNYLLQTAHNLGIPQILIDSAVLDGCLDVLVNTHIDGMAADQPPAIPQEDVDHCTDCGSAIGDGGWCSRPFCGAR